MTTAKYARFNTMVVKSFKPYLRKKIYCRYQNRKTNATVKKKGMTPLVMIVNSLNVCGASKEATKREIEKANTESLNASIRKISLPLDLNLSFLTDGKMNFRIMAIDLVYSDFLFFAILT